MGKNKIFETIYKSKRKRAAFIKAFKEKLEEYGETLFDTKDLYIFEMFKHQGYWSGVKFNIHYDEEEGFWSETRRLG